jgi:hypothetical protein
MNTNGMNNEQLFLINILNTMYNDNLDQINNLTYSNNQIRNLLVQLLYPQNLNNNSRRQPRTRQPSLQNNYSNTNTNTNTNNTNNTNINTNINANTNANTNNTNANTNAYLNTNNASRILINNIPYIIDSITEYDIPINTFTSLYGNNYRNNNRNNSNATNTTNTNVTNTTNANATNTTNLFNEIFESFLQPINIFPTQSQIETATRRVYYRDILQPINSQCPISMEEFTDSDLVTVIRPCGHIFHTEYLMNWFSTNCKCPVCRYDIRNYNSVTSTEYNNANNANNYRNIRNNRNRSQINDASNNRIERNIPSFDTTNFVNAIFKFCMSTLPVFASFMVVLGLVFLYSLNSLDAIES